MDDIEWAHHGALVDWKDGHQPEHCSSPTRLLVVPSPSWSLDHDGPDARVQVHDDTVDPVIVDAAYHHTVREGKPWGTYVTMEQAEQQQQQQQQQVLLDRNNEVSTPQTWTRDELAQHLVAYFLRNAFENQPTLEYTASGACRSWNRSDVIFQDAHGVAVWALPASVLSQVPYHLDYAEQVRYEYNIIVPPVLAGTLHCTQGTIQGGDFRVHLEGLEHYQRHGYKACLAPIADDDGIRIPYRYNRMIITSGQLPHSSSVIQSLPNDSTLRVIVGFNVFGKDIGAMVQAAPEHSYPFRRKISLQRMLRSSTTFSLHTIQACPKLKRMLVLAKREKVKNDFKAAIIALDRDLELQLQKSSACTVQGLVDALGQTDEWPRPDDVRVHIHRRWKEGRIRVVQTSHDDDDDDDSASLVSLEAVVEWVSNETDPAL